MASSTCNLTRIIQQNLGRSRVAWAQLGQHLCENHTSIALIQEPYTLHFNIPTSTRYRVLSYNDIDNTLTEQSRPRAAILTQPNIYAMLISQFTTRDICVAEVTIQNKNIIIASVYLPPADDVDLHLQIIQELCQKYPRNVIVCGDFNAHHLEWGSTSTNSRGRDIIDLFSALDFHLLNLGSTPTFYTIRNNVEYTSIVDLSFVSSELIPHVHSWNVCKNDTASDHHIISFNVSSGRNLSNQVTSSTRLYITKSINWSRFSIAVGLYRQKWADNIMMALTKEDVETVADMIINDIKATCQLTLTKAKIRKRCVPWWNIRLTELRTLTNYWKRKYKTVASPALKEEYLQRWLDHAKDYKEEIDKSKKKSWREFLCLQNKETVWSQAYRLCKKVNVSPPTTVKKSDSEATENAQETANYLLHHFFPDDNEINETKHHSHIRLLSQSYHQQSQCDDLLFSQEEVGRVILSQNDKKAPGEDAITANIVKAVYDTMPSVITSFYNLCLRIGCFPKCFKTSIVRVIPKPGGDRTTPKEWRPISLLPVMGKILEKLLIDRIMFDLSSRGKLSNKQFGFTPKRSTTDALKLLTDHIRETLDTKKYSVVVSLDVAGAFDNAWWSEILYKLKRMNIPKNLWELCRSYFSERQATLNLAGAIARKLVTKGCPQGSACGPGFWNVLYNSVLEMSLPFGCELLAFADDLMLLNRHDNVQELEATTNEAINRITSWGRAVKLCFNETKTKLMFVHTKRNQTDPDIYMNGMKLQIVEVVRYLGVMVDRKLTWKAHLFYLHQKSKKLMQNLVGLARNTWGLSSSVIETIYRGAVEPALLYGAEIWHEAARRRYFEKKLAQIQRSFLLRIAKSYRTVSHEALCAVTAIPPISLRLAEIISIGQTNKLRIYQTIPIQRDITSPHHPATSFYRYVYLSPLPTSSPYLKVFTDGSKINDSVGGAFVWYRDKQEINQFRFRLPAHCSVFQAEMMAIDCALQQLEIVYQTETDIIIWSDSLSSLQAIRDCRNCNTLVQSVQQRLINLKNKNVRVRLSWIRGHNGNIGNERADQLAKDNSDGATTISLGAPLSMAKRHLRQLKLERWQAWWVGSTKALLTREWIPSIEARLKIGHIQHDFYVTQLLTGHGGFGDFLFRIGARLSSECQCGDDRQTVKHLLFCCPLTRPLRTALDTGGEPSLAELLGGQDRRVALTSVARDIIVFASN